MFRFKKLMMVFGALLVSQIICISGISSGVLAKDDGFIYGDVNGDEAINAVDFAYMRQHLLGIISEFKSVNGIKAADVDGNGTFNAIDFADMRKYLLGIIKYFPVSTPTSEQTPTVTPTSPSISDFINFIPSNIDVKMMDSNSIVLCWDKIGGAVSYEVYRDGVSVGTTSTPTYTHFNAIEGADYTYCIRAINETNEKSLYSDEIIVNTGDIVINSDTLLNENRFYKSLKLDFGAILDINGHILDIQSDFIQIGGEVNINSGRLTIGRDYSIENYGVLKMLNDSDYVYIGRNYTMKSDYDFSLHNLELSAGIMEIKGDLTNDQLRGDFVATGSHMLVLSGDGEQTVSRTSFKSRVAFNELEIRNETGVRFDSPISIRIIKGTYKILEKPEIEGIESVAGDVTVVGDVTIHGDVDMNGYNFTVTGDLIHGGEMNIDSGRLTVGRDYYSAALKMTNSTGYVFVGRNFATRNVYLDGSDFVQLYAGTMEVKGNFTNWQDEGDFAAAGSHKVILSGDSEQVVSTNYFDRFVFGSLEIRNESGVRFDSPIELGIMEGNYNVKGRLEISNIDLPLTEDVIVDGDLEISGGTLNLNGYDLTINGNLIQSSDYNNSLVKLSGGRLNVQENYYIGTEREGPDDICYSTLQMTNDADYLFVEGDFSTSMGYANSDLLSAGVMEIKGDFINMVGLKGFNAYGSHKVILSGDSEQVVDNSSLAILNKLEIRNNEGVRFNSAISIRQMEGYYKVIGKLTIANVVMVTGDVTIDGDLEIGCGNIKYDGLTMIGCGGVLDLNGYKLSVIGNLVETDKSYFYDFSFFDPTRIIINGGNLIVNGNYNMDGNYIVLQMTNTSDYVYVGGNFTTSTSFDHSKCLNAGTLEVKGDFIRNKGTDVVYELSHLAFWASGTHRVVLSGNSVQNVTFEDPNTSSLNILKITKPLDTGYIFSKTPVWKTLEQ